ncbi:MAG: Plug domain-containing protein [Pseudomonadota bacterium]|nr:Plug domain-containing protein [Pseudomonadota bacterium]
MSGIKSNTFVDDFDPLTPTLSRREREKKTVPLPEGQGPWRGTRNLKYVWLVLNLMPWAARGDEPVQLPPIEVTERYDSLIGIGDSATAGRVGPEQIESRPLLRPGEVLETVPGVIITQHSGAGKANQFFLRGFNLDHGTDFATSVAGIPVNLPTHGHGQGYTDLNFVIPEIIGGIDYRKGPYYADEGDFSAAGAARIDYANTLPRALVQFTGGSYDYYRGLMAGSTALAAGQVLGAFEVFDNDGPWDHPDEYRRYRGAALQPGRCAQRFQPDRHGL